MQTATTKITPDFDIAGKSILILGGAASHDVDGGILDPDASDYEERLKEAEKGVLPFRIKNISWWDRELPSEAEYANADTNLAAHNCTVDYIITHCAATSTQNRIRRDGSFQPNTLTDYLEKIKTECTYKAWFFGHYHMNQRVSEKEWAVYKEVVEIR